MQFQVVNHFTSISAKGRPDFGFLPKNGVRQVPKSAKALYQQLGNRARAEAFQAPAYFLRI